MNFYEELVYSEEDLDKTYRIRTASNNQYKFCKRDTQIDWSEKYQMLIFTDTDGNRFRFQTADVEVLEPADTEKMTAGEWPLTLFTCTPGGQSRLAVRCQPIQSLPSGSSESESLF